MENKDNVKKFFYRFIKEINKYNLMKNKRYGDLEIFNHSLRWRYTREGYSYWLLVQIVYAHIAMNKFNLEDFDISNKKDYIDRLMAVYGGYSRNTHGVKRKYKQKVSNASKALIEEIQKISV